MADSTEIKELLDSIRPDILGWMDTKLAEAVLTGVQPALPSGLAYKDRSQTFLGQQFFADGVVVGQLVTGYELLHVYGGRAKVEDDDLLGGVLILQRSTSGLSDGAVGGLIRTFAKNSAGNDTIITDVYFTIEETGSGNVRGGVWFVNQEADGDVVPLRLIGDNIGIGTSATPAPYTDFGGGHGVISVVDATTVPTTLPASGGIAYSESGRFKWRRTNGRLDVLGSDTVNLLLNSQYRYHQRKGLSAASISDDQYGPDRWYVLTQTASINVERSTGDVNSLYACKLTQTQAAAQRIGIAQIVEGDRSSSVRGRPVRFQCRVKISNSQAVRVAIVQHTGTINSVTSDIVNDWTSTDYTDGGSKFFVDANLVPLATATLTPSAATWTDISVGGTLATTCTNIIVFVWTEGTAAQNVTLEITEAGLYDGAQFRDYCALPEQVELDMLSRYYWKTFPTSTAPVQNAGTGTGEFRFMAGLAGAAANQASFFLPVQLFTSPTVTAYNPAAANAQARDVTAGADCSGTTVSCNGKIVVVDCTGNAGTAAGNSIRIHCQLDAEL